jgi:hypothetical protein
LNPDLNSPVNDQPLVHTTTENTAHTQTIWNDTAQKSIQQAQPIEDIYPSTGVIY